MSFRPFAKLGAASVLSALTLGLVVAPSGLLPVASAQAQANARDEQAEQFVGTEAQNALAILSNRGLSIADKKRAFRGFIDRVADVPKITTFVLGKYARSITHDQMQRFAPIFRDYASSVYEGRLKEYRGETFKVTGSVVRRPGDVVVQSVVSGGHLDAPIPVSWRVMQTAGRWRVVDVQVKGVWLAITEQQDFVSTIDNANGDINVLIGQLQRQLASGGVK